MRAPAVKMIIVPIAASTIDIDSDGSIATSSTVPITTPMMGRKPVVKCRSFCPASAARMAIYAARVNRAISETCTCTPTQIQRWAPSL